jgi:hypothetical protein
VAQQVATHLRQVDASIVHGSSVPQGKRI